VTHPASYPVDTAGCIRRGKAVGAWSCPFSSIQRRG